MKLSQKIAHTVLATAFMGSVNASEANPVEMAHKVGFLGCDSLISQQFEYALKSSERRFSVQYFDETVKSSVDIYVTFGSSGDTIFQTVHFEKSSGMCYSTGRSMISELGNCAGILNKDEYFKYKDESAGALWSENKGGIGKLFIQSGNACNQIFIQSKIVKATK